jgi:ATP-dependent helicase YprA (DUF1998 family)
MKHKTKILNRLFLLLKKVLWQNIEKIKNIVCDEVTPAFICVSSPRCFNGVLVKELYNFDGGKYLWPMDKRMIMWVAFKRYNKNKNTCTA